MVRFPAISRLAGLAVCLVLLAPVLPGSPTPVAPILWTATRLRNLDYVSVRDLAKNFELKAAWTKPESVMTLSDARGVRFTIEGNQKDLYFDGLRIFLGAPAILHKDSLWVAKLDVIKIVAPLFRPASDAATAASPIPPSTVSPGATASR